MCRNTQNTRLFGVRLAILLYAVGTTMWSMRIEEDHTRWMQRLTHWGCACTIVYFARSTYFSYTQLNEIVGKAAGDNVLNNAAPTLFVFTLANSLMYWAILLTVGYKGRHTFSDIWELQVHIHFVINVWFAIDIFMTRVRFSYVHLWSALLAHILYMVCSAAHIHIFNGRPIYPEVHWGDIWQLGIVVGGIAVEVISYMCGVFLTRVRDSRLHQL
eukprot:359697_1